MNHLQLSFLPPRARACAGPDRVMRGHAVSISSWPHYTEQLHLYSGTMFVNSDGEEEELGPELVFSLMDFIVVALLMVVTFLWFRSKHVNRFYEACKESEI